MSNESAKTSGGGNHRSWGVRWGGRVGSLSLALALWASASVALAAEVVEVRVGNHPTFTRVVFELDRAAGYRIERAQSADGSSALVVSLEATSIPRKVRSSKTLIEQVEVSPSGQRSVARIALAKDGLKLKEMILASPPRIVLDVMSDKPVAVAKKKKAAPKVAKKTTKPTKTTATTTANAVKTRETADRHVKQYVNDTTSKTASAVDEAKAKAAAAAEKAKARAAAEAEKAKAKAAAEAAKAKELAAAEAAKAKELAAAKAAKAKADAEAAKKKAAEVAAVAKAKADAAAKETAAKAAEAKAAAAAKLDAASTQLADAKQAAADTIDKVDDPGLRAEVLNKLGEDAGQVADGTAQAAKSAADSAASAAGGFASSAIDSAKSQANAAAGDAAGAAKQASRPMVAKTKKADDGGGILTWALAGVGALVLLAGGLFVARRRSGGSVDYADPDEDPAADSDAAFETDDTPALFGSDADENAATENPFAATESDGAQLNLGDADATIASTTQDSDDEKESESVVFEDSEGETMEVISRDAVNESLGMPPTGGGIPEEFQQMMREMASRVEALESRCDELVDARDRLERQVAAQTEELRVQRAAIARTQRAVRNLARPEDEESEATEPALRDPNQPSSQD